MPGLLQRLDPKQVLEMAGTVVIAATDSKRRWNQPFLDVIPDRAPRYATKFSEVTDGVPRFVRHESFI